MSVLFKKLNFTTQQVIHILNAPDSLNTEIALLRGPEVRRTLGAKDRTGFVIAFASKQAEVDRLSKTIAAAADGDAVVWFAYPKQSSKRYSCEFNRDTGWAVLGGSGFEPVRMVAVDEDWSALRFRRVEFIKRLTRRAGSALSAEGRARTS